MPSADVTAFLPSRDGFRFRNAFADDPVVTLLGRWRIGRAGNGLCGGMVFAACDFFEAGQPVPADVVPPAADSPLYRYIVRRLFAAFNLPLPGARYLYWMLLPDATVLARTWQVQWPRIKGLLDAGHPCPIGIVTVRSGNPAQLRRNHVVLCYAYEGAKPRLTLRVYDPNSGPTDDVVIELTDSAATSNIDVGYPVRGLFALRYRPRTIDPAVFRPPARRVTPESAPSRRSPRWHSRSARAG